MKLQIAKPELWDIFGPICPAAKGYAESTLVNSGLCLQFAPFGSEMFYECESIISPHILLQKYFQFIMFSQSRLRYELAADG